MADQVGVAGRGNEVLGEVHSSSLIHQVLRSLTLSSFLSDLCNQLRLFVCDEGLLRIHVFVSWEVLMICATPLAGRPLRCWAHYCVLVGHGSIVLVTVRCSIITSVIGLAPMNVLIKLSMRFLHHHRLSFGVEESLLLDGKRVVVVGEDVLLLLVQLLLNSGLLIVGIASGRRLDRRMTHLGVIGWHTVASIVHLYFEFY